MTNDLVANHVDVVGPREVIINQNTKTLEAMDLINHMTVNTKNHTIL
jgi:hypothetical protein